MIVLERVLQEGIKACLEPAAEARVEEERRENTSDSYKANKLALMDACVSRVSRSCKFVLSTQNKSAFICSRQTDDN